MHLAEADGNTVLAGALASVAGGRLAVIMVEQPHSRAARPEDAHLPRGVPARVQCSPIRRVSHHDKMSAMSDGGLTQPEASGEAGSR